MPQRAFCFFKLLKDQTIDFSFAKDTKKENVAFVSIVTSVLQKLGEVVLDKHQFGCEEDKASEPSSSTGLDDGRIKFEWLGIGTTKTWHGYPGYG